MTDDDLLQIAWDFRVGLIGETASSEGCCYMVSAPLSTLLSAIYGVECELVSSCHDGVEGSDWIEHFWIMLDDGRVLDPTFDQFCSEEPLPVYIGRPTEFHQKVQGT